MTDICYETLTTTIVEKRIIATRWVVANFPATVPGLSIASPKIQSLELPIITSMMTLVLPNTLDENLSVELKLDNECERDAFLRFELSVNAKMLANETALVNSHVLFTKSFVTESLDSILKEVRSLNNELIILLRVYRICPKNDSAIPEPTLPPMIFPQVVLPEFFFFDKPEPVLVDSSQEEACDFQDPAIISVFSENPTKLFGLIRSGDIQKLLQAEKLILATSWPYLKYFVKEGIVKVLATIMYNADVEQGSGSELKAACFKCLHALLEVAGEEKDIIIDELPNFFGSML